MIVDIHGHVTAPPELYAYKAGQLASRGEHGRGSPGITDERSEQVLAKHLERLKNAQIDLQLISPRPFQAMHDARPEKIVRWYTEETNNLIGRQVKAHPDVFRGVCAMPQGPGISPRYWVDELERCVKEMGFVGCQINPDPGERGGDETPALGDEFWYPLYEKMVELDVPGLVHSAGCQSSRLGYSLHFINEENIAIISLLESRVFQDFPALKLLISHGGGAIPYQMGRFMAANFMFKRDAFEESVRKLYYDTCVYTKDAIELLVKTVGSDRVLFGTENPGTGSATNPKTGRDMDDLKPVIDSIEFLGDADRQAIYEGNARRLYRLD